jgi:hypothetical protein
VHLGVAIVFEAHSLVAVLAKHFSGALLAHIADLVQEPVLVHLCSHWRHAHAGPLRRGRCRCAQRNALVVSLASGVHPLVASILVTKMVVALDAKHGGRLLLAD